MYIANNKNTCALKGGQQLFNCRLFIVSYKTIHIKLIFALKITLESIMEKQGKLNRQRTEFSS